jgi:molybdopterin molybdotransferase
MRPGKPLAFGEYRGFPFIGLPGNPVSAFRRVRGFRASMCLQQAGRPLGRKQVEGLK